MRCGRAQLELDVASEANAAAVMTMSIQPRMANRSMTLSAQLTTMLTPESCYFFFVTRLTPPFSSAADPILRWGRIGTMLLAELAEELLLRR